MPVGAASGSAVLLAAPVSAHDIPSDVTVQAFMKPEGHTLRVLVRLPLKTVMDVEFPRREREFVDLARVDQSLRDAATIALSNNIELYEGDTLLPDPRIVSTRMSLESDRSFATYEAALAHVTGPAAAQRHDDFLGAGHPRRALRISDPVGSFVFLDPCRVRSVRAEGRHRAAIPAAGRNRPRLRAGRRRRTGEARSQMVPGGRALRHMGFFHILDGTDHLLFLLCLIIPFRRVRPLIPIVTAFTVAHSITLIASAYNYAPDALWFPPLIETLIATSVFYMALENIVVARPGRRWIITFLFGLVHGFGFLLRPAAHASVRRLAPADLAPLLQCRGRARPVARARAARASPQHPLPVRRGRAHGNDHPVGDRRPHGVALDDRAVRRAAAVSVAGGHGRRPCERPSMAHRRRGHRGGGVAAVPRDATVGKADERLFIAMGEKPKRLRVNGIAELSFDDPRLADFPGGQLLVRITPRHIFPNCPRYIPHTQLVASSAYVPQAAATPIEPAWKGFPDFKDVVPKRKPTA